MIDLNQVHTTKLGAVRIVRNLNLSTEVAVVPYCVKKIKRAQKIIRRGKNWYVYADDIVLTINAYNLCIITAHFVN